MGVRAAWILRSHVAHVCILGRFNIANFSLGAGRAVLTLVVGIVALFSPLHNFPLDVHAIA